MNNGDKLAQMTNEQKADFIINELGITFFFDTDKDKILPKLNTEVEKTADEDFAEIGFDLDEESNTCLLYSDAYGRNFEFGRSMQTRYRLCDGAIKIWTDKTIDQIRTIANKKRKELGW